MNLPNEEKKLIVDEDWKTQVQQEKELAKRGTAESPAVADQGEPRPATNASDSNDTDIPDLPPASFEWLVTSLATQAFVYLGQVPDPMDGKLHVMPNLAKHQIDMLAMLEEKTRGNLSQDESQLLDDVLHQLRLAYVTISRE